MTKVRKYAILETGKSHELPEGKMKKSDPDYIGTITVKGKKRGVIWRENGDRSVYVEYAGSECAGKAYSQEQALKMAKTYVLTEINKKK